MQLRKVFQFSLRTILVIMILAAIGPYWLGQPYYEHVREAAAKERLEELGWQVVAEEVPISLAQRFQARFHSVDTLSRVSHLRVHEGELTSETMELVLGLKHLSRLDLSGSSLTAKQCFRLLDLPELHVLDCHHTPVDYETLLTMRRRKPTLCHLAHRRAVAELHAMGIRPHTYSNERRAHNVWMDRTHFAGSDSTLVQAVRYFGRPLALVSITNMNLDDPLLDALRDVRADFQFGLNFTPKTTSGREVLGRSDFERMNRRVRKLSLVDLEFEHVFPLADSSLTELNLSGVGPNVLATFAASTISVFGISDLEGVDFDEGVFPSTIKALYMNSCKPTELDVSHCTQLRTIRLSGNWEAEYLLKLLDAPELQRVDYRFESSRPPAEVESRFRERGVGLDSRPVFRRLLTPPG